MRKMICLALAMIALNARATEQTFVESAGKHGGQELEVPKKLVGPVQFLKETIMVEGEEMVAGSNVRESWEIMFNRFGTPFLVHQHNGEPLRKLQIGAKGAGNQGNFEINGFPYVIRRNQLVTIDDSLMGEFLRRFKPLQWNRGWRVAGESAGGGTLAGLISAFSSNSLSAGLGSGLLVAAAVWGIQFRDQFLKESLFDQRRSIDLFTKRVLPSVSIARYEEVIVDKVVTDIRLITQDGRELLMKEIVAEGKMTPDFRNSSCINFLTKKSILK